MGDLFRKAVLSLIYKPVTEDDGTHGYLIVFKRFSAFAAENSFQMTVSSVWVFHGKNFFKECNQLFHSYIFPFLNAIGQLRKYNRRNRCTNYTTAFVSCKKDYYVLE